MKINIKIIFTQSHSIKHHYTNYNFDVIVNYISFNKEFVVEYEKNYVLLKIYDEDDY